MSQAWATAIIWLDSSRSQPSEVRCEISRLTPNSGSKVFGKAPIATVLVVTAMPLAAAWQGAAEAVRAFAEPAAHAKHGGAGGRNGSVGRASKIENVKEYIRLEITQVKGNVVYAQGSATGSFKAKAWLYLELVNASHAVARIYTSNSRGTISGYGPARYHASGSVSRFSGNQPPTMRGSGKFKDLRSVSIKLVGEMNRRTLKIWVNMTGKWDA